MKKTYAILIVIVLLIIAACTPFIDRKNLTGNWTASFYTTGSTNPQVFVIGATTSATFYINDNNGNLTITDIHDTSSYPVNWQPGTGYYDGTNFSATITGYYYNQNNDRVNAEIYLSGTIPDGRSGSGTFREAFSVYTGSVTGWGNATFNKN
ncbi:MAG TPA: hypothetical protein PK074_00120 [Spirochaetales bacterium]|nr:hypothetical protein [Spirochaetales bacterium]HQK33107.1 hypothetical protein [Spirochaetales bacterium]